MTSVSTIPELKANWINLHDLDRANAIRSIHDSGISLRQIARQLHKGESSLRRLLIALDAPVEDRLLARQGKLTTNELVRRSKAAGLNRAARHREEIALEQARETLRAADTICNWFVNIGIAGSFGEQIIDEVRREFADRELYRSLPSVPKNPDIPINTIIERSRPKRAMDNNADWIGWYHEWLCRWAFFAFPDPVVRDAALEIALQKQWTR
jgi:lambda repressor-like predicted transcriptional regulator